MERIHCFALLADTMGSPVKVGARLATACGPQCPGSREIEHMRRRMAELEARVVMIEGMLDKRYVVRPR
jgi:hypothetical protein